MNVKGKNNRKSTGQLLVVIINFFILATITGSLRARAQQLGPTNRELKFGVVVRNKNYTIYRSAKLGKSGLKKLEKHLEKNNLPFPKTIIYMNKTGYKFPFYFALDEYHQKNKYSFNFFHSFGEERTYLNGHNPYETDEDIDSKWNLGRHGRKHFKLRDDGVDGDVSDFFRILQMVLNEENQPVLFHCHGGRHRTGMIAMAIRYIQEGPWLEGHHHSRWGMDLNPAEYEYYKFNKLLFRKENVEFIRQLNTDHNFLLLKEKYGKLLRDEINQ